MSKHDHLNPAAGDQELGREFREMVRRLKTDDSPEGFHPAYMSRTVNIQIGEKEPAEVRLLLVSDPELADAMEELAAEAFEAIEINPKGGTNAGKNLPEV